MATLTKSDFSVESNLITQTQLDDLHESILKKIALHCKIHKGLYSYNDLNALIPIWIKNEWKKVADRFSYITVKGV